MAVVGVVVVAELVLVELLVPVVADVASDDHWQVFRRRDIAVRGRAWFGRSLALQHLRVSYALTIENEMCVKECERHILSRMRWGACFKTSWRVGERGC